MQNRGTLLHDAAHLQLQKRRPPAAWPWPAALGERRRPLVTQVSKASLSVRLRCLNKPVQVDTCLFEVLDAVLMAPPPDVLLDVSLAVVAEAVVSKRGPNGLHTLDSALAVVVRASGVVGAQGATPNWEIIWNQAGD